MCNAYRLRERQQVFEFPPGANVPTEVYPNYPGIVIESGTPRVMNWGFPLRLKSMKPTSKPKPVNNARDDRLHKQFWRDSFEKRRCLIPVTQWAEPQGEQGRMTRTWYGLPGVDTFFVAGIWRPTDEWGDCYSMVMTSACAQMMQVHDRMPIILEPPEYDQWTQGNPTEALSLIRPWPGELSVDASDEP